MESCDVLIVGGGPAGSSCAWALRGSGLDVAILDKARFPRDKICGGWITPQVVEELQIDLDDYARTRALQPIMAFRLGAIGGREVEIPYHRPVSYGIRRCEFDHYLLQRSGARVFDGMAIQKVERDGGGWRVQADTEFRARLLVGAGGHFCPIARMLGNSNQETPVVAQEVEFLMGHDQAAACAVQPETPELYFCRDLRGYGWCFRKGDFLNIGLGRLDQHKLSEHVRGFADFLRRSGRVNFELPQRFPGHAYLLHGYSQRKLVDDAVLLIGDAAGLAYAQSGEGIRPAVESGLMAAEAIASATGDYSSEQLSAYGAALQERYGVGKPASGRLSALIPEAARNGLARLLLSSAWFCRNTVVENWFLHMNDAPMASPAGATNGHAKNHLDRAVIQS
jgi:geranylgeranyl reductase family protein